MSNLSSFEKIERALNLELLERESLPVIPQLTYASAAWNQIKISEALNDTNKQFACLKNAYTECKYDGIYAQWEGSFTLLANSLGAPIDIAEDRPPSIIKPIIFSSEDIEAIKDVKLDNLSGLGRIPVNLNLIKLFKTKKAEIPLLNYVPGPFTLAGLMYGLDKFMINIYDNPKFIDLLTTFCSQASYHFGLAKIEAGIDIITIAEPSGSSDLISPKHFEKFCLNPLRNLIGQFKREKIHVGLHICGYTEPILQLMNQTGAEFLELDSRVDLQRARELIKNTICIVGNIDTSILTSKSPKEIQKLCMDCTKKLGGYGHILSSGCEIPFNTPIENIKAMVNWYKKL